VVVLCLYFTVSDHEKLNVLMDDGDERCFALINLQAGFPIRCMNIRRLMVVCSTWLQSTKGPCRSGTDPNWMTYGLNITGQFLAIVDYKIIETFTYLATIYSYKIQLCIFLNSISKHLSFKHSMFDSSKSKET